MLQFRDTASSKDERVTLEDCLPKLNAGGLFTFLENGEAQRKREVESIETFGTELIKLVLSGLFDIKEKFITKILSFFELEECVKKRHRQRPEKDNIIVNCNILDLPHTLIANILSFLTKKDLVSVSYSCKELSNIAMSPFLWKNISLRSRSNYVDDKFVEKIVKKYTQITTLDLSYCDEIGSNTTFAISQYCSPLHLRELNLDGCKKIGDQALKHLVLKFLPKSHQEQTSENEPEPEPFEIENQNQPTASLDSIQSTKLEKKLSQPEEIKGSKFTPIYRPYKATLDNKIGDEKILKGGARGLRKITLSECKQVTDKGIAMLAKIPELKSLSLLSCHHVTDKGVCWLLEKCKEIEELNLGGTQITSRTLDFISEECPNVKRLSIKGCSGFSEVDVQKLEKRGIEVEYGEGTCRFFLLSERESELPSISSNSFKGRTTLSIHRLQNFAKEKLKAMGREVNELELLFEKKVLEDHLTLQDLLAFNTKKDEVILTYRKKKNLTKKAFAPDHPKPWICKKDVCECMNPECKQIFDIFHNKLNCYSCGAVFCDQCTQFKTPIKHLGYDDPMRVCILCWLSYKELS